MMKHQQFKGLINYKPSASENLQTTTTTSTTSTTTNEDNKQRIEFVHHKLNKHLLQQDDLVLIIVPEEFEILQVIDPMLHGKVGHIASLSNEDDDETVQVSLGSNSLRRPTTNGDHHGMMTFSSSSSLSGTRSTPIVTVPKFCVCLKADVFNERKEKFMSQRRTNSSHEHYSASINVQHKHHHHHHQRTMMNQSSSPSVSTDDLSQNTVTTTATTISMVSSRTSSDSTSSSSSSPTTTTQTPMYSLGPKIQFNLQNRQKRGTSSATTPVFNHSPSSSFLHSSTTTIGAVGQTSSSSSSTTTHRRLSSATSNLSSCFHHSPSIYSSPNKPLKQTSPKRSALKQPQFFMDESDDCKGLAGSVPKFINSYMLTDTEIPNVYSADIPNHQDNKANRDDMDLDSLNEIIGTTVFTHKRERVS
ncbi:hypothetical protein FDP41_002773 [Naegleria fowleri]|uniref:Uncharacterized protein n=1 Tax=Naegleria fowleri TaxID=5763 RepID=A0A6A5BWP6_NAEFO|nr:uncharacterized protein FDP41_002773 [Naegleria fowleri]KAF0978258.1 hypothetical protein FDP41_002773 [Naegleria fowleri]